MSKSSQLDDDYGAIEAAVSETPRGRAFLIEYARRVRQSDIMTMLASLARLERVCDNQMALLERTGESELDSSVRSIEVDPNSALAQYGERVARAIREMESLVSAEKHALTGTFRDRNSGHEEHLAGGTTSQISSEKTEWTDEIQNALREFDRRIASLVLHRTEIREQPAIEREACAKPPAGATSVSSRNPGGGVRHSEKPNEQIGMPTDESVLADIAEALRT
jgi:hypothetical protein